jgi:hypothetical protein
MPSRLTLAKRVDASEVQGEGAWVEIRARTYGESKRYFEMAEKGALTNAAALEENEILIAKHVIAWNWVDENGDEMPLPSSDPSVLMGLTTDEAHFLTRVITGTDNPNG